MDTCWSYCISIRKAESEQEVVQHCRISRFTPPKALRPPHMAAPIGDQVLNIWVYGGHFIFRPQKLTNTSAWVNSGTLVKTLDMMRCICYPHTVEVEKGGSLAQWLACLLAELVNSRSLRISVRKRWITLLNLAPEAICPAFFSQILSKRKLTINETGTNIRLDRLWINPAMLSISVKGKIIFSVEKNQC